MFNLKKVTAFLRRGDILGNKFEITMRGQSSFQTILGSLVTLIGVAVIITFAVSEILIAMDDTSPTVRDFLDYGGQESFIDLVDTGLVPVFSAIDVVSN